MANLVSRDVQTTTGTNLKLVEKASGLCAWDTNSNQLRAAIEESETVDIEQVDKWRVPFLNKLLGNKQELQYLGADIEEINGLINSLCIN